MYERWSSSSYSIDLLLESLKIRYLANRDACLQFALLTDFQDASQEAMPNDLELVEHARRGIERLNQTYALEDFDKFFLLHRCGKWNESEGT